MEYTDADVAVATFEQNIDLFRKFLLHEELQELDSIVMQLCEQFLFLGIEEFSVIKKENFVLIKSNPDWVSIGEDDVKKLFSKICRHNNLPVDAIRKEILIKAFEYRFFTYGELGEAGDITLMEEAKGIFSPSQLKSNGRVLILLDKADQNTHM